MKFMVIVKGCNGEHTPGPNFPAEMGKYNEELHNAGVLLALEGLAPATTATCVTFTGKNQIATDGPFAESKELVGGFWLWNCTSQEEALEWLKRAPFEKANVEIRQVVEDFAESFARAYREQNEITGTKLPAH
ncbi:MAG TPA: YciI family protein [Kiritimatiellia bacterium]|nr:YciI family protein [Kiritimatiellia bacterium]